MRKIKSFKLFESYLPLNFDYGQYDEDHKFISDTLLDLEDIGNLTRWNF